MGHTVPKFDKVEWKKIGTVHILQKLHQTKRKKMKNWLCWMCEYPEKHDNDGDNIIFI